MDLHQRLTEIRQAFESGETPRETIDVLNGNIEKLLAADVLKDALRVGDLAPLELSIQSNSGPKPLSRFFAQKYLVLTWFRGNW